jgi:hypothetical protein
MTTATQKRNDYLQAVDQLAHIAENAENGGLVVITIKSTSKSNLSFKFDVRQYYQQTGSNRIVSDYLNWTYAQLMGLRRNDHGEVKGSGLGIDRAFEVANNLEGLIETHLKKTVKINYEGVY